MLSTRTRIAATVLLTVSTVTARNVAAQQAETKPAIDFSGLLLGNYRYTHHDATKAANGGHAANKFDMERVYLTFRMPAGDNGSIRVTTDIFNQTSSPANSYYAGWAVRLKYAYFQYNFLRDIGGHKGFTAGVRVGMLQNALIEHEETFWTRWISQTAVERSAFFSSSDVGVAGLLTLPGKWGEVYTSYVNGPGYATSETDRYKDFSARLSLTPFGKQENIAKTFTISPYVYMGHTASKFLATAGTSSEISDGLKRNRTGVFVGLKDRRLTLGGEIGKRTETVETGATIDARTAYDNTGTLTSAFAIVRPVELFDAKKKSRFGAFIRLDNYKPYSDQRSAGPTNGAQTTNSANQLLIGGVFWDLTSKASFSLDVQNTSPKKGSTAAESKVLFAHMQVQF